MAWKTKLRQEEEGRSCQLLGLLPACPRVASTHRAAWARLRGGASRAARTRVFVDSGGEPSCPWVVSGLGCLVSGLPSCEGWGLAGIPGVTCLSLRSVSCFWGGDGTQAGARQPVQEAWPPWTSLRPLLGLSKARGRSVLSSPGGWAIRGSLVVSGHICEVGPAPRVLLVTSRKKCPCHDRHSGPCPVRCMLILEWHRLRAEAPGAPPPHPEP